LKPISTLNQIKTIPKTFNIDLPYELCDMLYKAKDDKEVNQIGIEWCIKQSKELMKSGVPCLHYYTMGRSESVRKILKSVF
jgi:methylenetetrahydrofolate reductase (NADPH)